MAHEIPYADPVTKQVNLYRRSWDHLMSTRMAFRNRAVDYESGDVRVPYLLEMSEEGLQPLENSIRYKLDKLIREHPMSDWLGEAKTRGTRVAVVLAAIRHPHRFPGQRCSGYQERGKPPARHYMLPTFDPGQGCPCEIINGRDADPEPCPGIVEPPRRGTGVRALWHMSGMMPVKGKDGKARLASYRRGEQGTFNREIKTAIMMRQGIAEQFLAQHSRYAEPYYEAKERLAALHPDAAPGWLHGTSKVIAAKAWLGDLLMEWKRRVPLEGCADQAGEIEGRRGAPLLEVAHA